MLVRSRLIATPLSLIVLLVPFQPALARDANQSEPSIQQPGRAPQKEPPRGSTDKQEAQADSQQAMRQAIRDIAAEIDSLRGELQRFRKWTELNGQTLELLLNEERLSRIEDKIQVLTDQKSQLDAREQDIQRRMRNIPGEMLLRPQGATLKRDEAEAAVKLDLQRALDDVRNQQSISQNRLAELTLQAERLRVRIAALRAKVDQAESKR